MKQVYDKTATRSRRELVGRVFSEGCWTRMQANAPLTPAGAWARPHANLEA